MIINKEIGPPISENQHVVHIATGVLLGGLPLVDHPVVPIGNIFVTKAGGVRL